MSDEQKTIEQIQESIKQSTWNEIRVDYQREDIIILNDRLDFQTVAISLIQDRNVQLQAWITDGLITLPLPEEDQQFKKDEVIFNHLFISPYCIIKKI